MKKESSSKGERKNSNLNNKIEPKQTNPVLSNPDVKKHLEKLLRIFVIVTTDEASKNFAFTCRKYYISKLFADVSHKKNKNWKPTYSH